MIEDNWQQNYGQCDFKNRSPDPKAIIDTLHARGFKVSNLNLRSPWLKTRLPARPCLLAFGKGCPLLMPANG